MIGIIVLVTLMPEMKRCIAYSHQGKLEALGRTFYDSSAMTRGIRRIMDWRNSLGKWKFLLGLAATIVLVFAFFLIYILR